MPKRINKAVVISDLHLGKENSILNPTFFSWTYMKELVRQMSSVGVIDELILLGDFVDFSLTTLREAYKNAQEFFNIIGKLENIKEIIYIPGNHDHHLWIELVETKDIIEKISKGYIPAHIDTYVENMVDRTFGNNGESIFLHSLLPLRKDGTKIQLKVKYPHHSRAFGDKKRQYLFTHGHYLEDMFKATNLLLEPSSLAELESFNCLWLEGFWYHMGQSGRFAEFISQVLEELRNGTSKTASSIIVKTLNILEKKYRIFWLKIPLFKKLIIWSIGKKLKNFNAKKRAHLAGSPFDEKQRLRIKDYIEKFILNRYTPKQGRKQIPTPFTFVYGHTHRHFDGESVWINGMRYDVVNTGGWFAREAQDNAGMLIIDEKGHRWQNFFENSSCKLDDCCEKRRI